MPWNRKVSVLITFSRDGYQAVSVSLQGELTKKQNWSRMLGYFRLISKVIKGREGINCTKSLSFDWFCWSDPIFLVSSAQFRGLFV